jgi:hypothetical protein
MIEFEIGGNQYRADKLNVFQQFHVQRKIAPLIPPLIPVFLRIQEMRAKQLGLVSNLASISELLQPFADGLAGLPDADAEFVLSTCLAVVRRRAGDHWAPVWSASAKALMFDDLDLGSALPIVVRVIRDNLGPFIQGLLTSQQPADQPAA